MDIRCIEDIAREFGLGLEESGSELRCVCPRHDDTNPSLYINPHKQQWICFGCGVGGGPVRFYSFIADCSMSDAIKALGIASVLATYLQRTMTHTDDDDDVCAYLLRDLLVDADTVEMKSRLLRAVMDKAVTSEKLIQAMVP